MITYVEGRTIKQSFQQKCACSYIDHIKVPKNLMKKGNQSYHFNKSDYVILLLHTLHSNTRMILKLCILV